MAAAPHSSEIKPTNQQTICFSFSVQKLCPGKLQQPRKWNNDHEKLSLKTKVIKYLTQCTAQVQKNKYSTMIEISN